MSCVGPREGPLGPSKGPLRKEGPLGPRSYQSCHLPASVSYLISIIIASTRRDSGVKLVENLAKNCVVPTYCRCVITSWISPLKWFPKIPFE